MPWCVVIKKEFRREYDKIYGKWLVFKDYDELNATWKSIVTAILEDRLEKCCTAKSSTLFYNPSCGGPGPSTSGVICVYTWDDDIDAVGYKLIQLVKQDIKYKTDEDTLKYKYSHVGVMCTIKTLYYNDGHPSMDLVDKRCFGTTLKKEDIWRINEEVNLKLAKPGADYGRWILTLEYQELSGLWHEFKWKIRDGNMRALRMVCPPKIKRSSKDEKPVFHVYTTEEDMKSVGGILILEVCRDITFEKKNGYPHYTNLYWNEGEYAYEKITRKGITKNWRTGEDM